MRRQLEQVCAERDEALDALDDERRERHRDQLLIQRLQQQLEQHHHQQQHLTPYLKPVEEQGPEIRSITTTLDHRKSEREWQEGEEGDGEGGFYREGVYPPLPDEEYETGNEPTGEPVESLGRRDDWVASAAARIHGSENHPTTAEASQSLLSGHPAAVLRSRTEKEPQWPVGHGGLDKEPMGRGGRTPAVGVGDSFDSFGAEDAISVSAGVSAGDETVAVPPLSPVAPVSPVALPLLSGTPLPQSRVPTTVVLDIDVGEGRKQKICVTADSDPLVGEWVSE